jgi:hypothetical protein
MENTNGNGNHKAPTLTELLKTSSHKEQAERVGMLIEIAQMPSFSIVVHFDARKNTAEQVVVGVTDPSAPVQVVMEILERARMIAQRQLIAQAEAAGQSVPEAVPAVEAPQQ